MIGTAVHFRKESSINQKKRMEKFQLEKVLKECMGDKDLLSELVKLFKRNVEEFVANTTEHLALENVSGIGFASHKIKASLKMMHLEGLFDIATQMNTICKTDGDLKHLQFLFVQFKEEYGAMEKTIDKALQRL